MPLNYLRTESDRYDNRSWFAWPDFNSDSDSEEDQHRKAPASSGDIAHLGPMISGCGQGPSPGSTLSLLRTEHEPPPTWGGSKAPPPGYGPIPAPPEEPPADTPGPSTVPWPYLMFGCNRQLILCFSSCAVLLAGAQSRRGCHAQSTGPIRPLVLPFILVFRV